MPPEQLAERTASLAGEITRCSPLAAQLAKAAIAAGSDAAEAIAGGLAAGSADKEEGVTSFREKRPPDFSGE